MGEHLSIQTPLEIDTPSFEAVEPRTSSEEITTSLHNAQNRLLQITANGHFHNACNEAGIDPFDDMDKPGYWELLADFTSNIIAKKKQVDGSSLDISALELLTSTPAFIFSQYQLDKAPERSKVHSLLERTTKFHRLIKDFALAFPETSANELSRSLLSVANFTLESRDVKHHANRLVTGGIRGAQHELGFAQIAKEAGFEIEETDVVHDIHGTDYKLRGIYGILPIDVKSSLYDIQTDPDDEGLQAYNIKNGKIVMFSLIEDGEFRDRFFLPKAVAQQKVPAFQDQIRRAERDLDAA